MTQIKILHLIASSRGGGATHMRDVVLALHSPQYEMLVAMTEDGGNVRREDFQSSDIPFHPLNIAEGFSANSLQNIRRLASSVDILHVHGARTAMYGRLAARTLGRRRPAVCFSVQGFSAPHYSFGRRTTLLTVERTLAPLTDCFLASCHAEKNALIEARVAPANKVQVVWNAVDAEPFQRDADDPSQVREQLGLPADCMVVTTACRLHKPRDFDTLFRSFGAIITDRPNAYLLLAGDGPLRPALEKQIADLRLANHVKLLGWRSDLPEIYAASDIYVLTTWGWEGLPLTVLEAMAAGLPVVVTRAGGAPEAVVEGETGFLVERRSADDLEIAFRRLIDNSQLRQIMGANARKRVCQHFSIPPMAQKVAEIYERLAQRVRS